MYSTGHLKNHWLLSIVPVVVLATFIFLIASGDLTSGTITTSNKSTTLNTTPPRQTAAKYKIGITVQCVHIAIYRVVEVDAAGTEATGPTLWS